jgi:hypothetical protein
VCHVVLRSCGRIGTAISISHSALQMADVIICGLVKLFMVIYEIGSTLLLKPASQHREIRQPCWLAHFTVPISWVIVKRIFMSIDLLFMSWPLNWQSSEHATHQCTYWYNCEPALLLNSAASSRAATPHGSHIFMSVSLTLVSRIIVPVAVFVALPGNFQLLFVTKRGLFWAR